MNKITTYELDQEEAEFLNVQVVEWIRAWFLENGPDCNAVIGISGGKDSSVAAALCVEALGKDRVIGVLMPQGEQVDIDCSLELVKHLGIRYYEINIGKSVEAILNEMQQSGIEVQKQTKMNLPARIRMSTLYAVSQSNNGRVVETSNLSETIVSWETRWGDAVGDLAPIVNLTVGEVKALGYVLGLPKHLIEKTPSDGLCGSSDEIAMGILYQEIDEYVRTGKTNYEAKFKIDERRKKYAFKRKPIPEFKPAYKNFLE